MSLGELKTMHSHFIIKPNPYISQDEAESAINKVVIAQTTLFLAAVGLSLSLFRVAPKYTRNSAYRKFNALAFGASFACFGWYALDLLKLRNRVPDEEFEVRNRGQDRMVYKN